MFNQNNPAVLKASGIIIILYLVLQIISIFITKIIFHFKKFNFENFERKVFSKKLKISTLSILSFFILCNFIIYFFTIEIFSLLPISSGIINSCTYISKIFFISLPFSTFQIIFLEYCCFIKNFKKILHLLFTKTFFFLIISVVFYKIFGFIGILYSKPTIDILFLPYYIIKLRKLIKILNHE